MRWLATGLMVAALLGGCDSNPPQIAAHSHHFGFEKVVSFDVLRSGGRIHLLVAGLGMGQTSLAYTWSADGGRHWAAVVPVGAAAPSPYGLGRGNDVQIAAAGKQLVAVWPTAGQGWGGTGPLASAWSQDAGQHWQPGPPPAPGFAGGEGYAAIKADAKGRFHLVWLDSRNGKQALYSAQSDDGGQNWGDPLAIDAASCECCTNELAVSPGGKMLVLYRDIEPRDMALAALDGAQQWQRRGVVGDFNWHFHGCPEAGGNLAVADGMLHALIWTGKPGAAGVYHLASVDGGHSWSRPQWLADVGSHHLALAARKKGHLAAAWGESNGGDVVVAVSNDGGENWSRRERFADSSHPRLLATPTGWLLAMLRGHVALVFVRL